ncbi:MAG: AAA family ATPase, partial [Chloroflexi bacterium]|nr:AAA family ATPase [Chloroflexota bacterium]
MTESEQPVATRHLMDAIAHLESQRAILGDAVVDAAVASLRQQLAELEPVAPPPLAGERKFVTIMFADIAGFTALAETLDPEAVRDLMNACFDRLVPVIERYEGTVDKFIGDEVMALFGAPIAHENDPERALRAALEMRDALAEFNAERGLDLGVHFGVNTGLVIAGGLGSEGREQYSVMGDAVNLAYRLEEASERGEILVGSDTHRLTAPLFRFEALAPVRVKGKAEPVPVYRLLATRAGPGKIRGIAGLESPLVGRQTERQALQEAIERVQVGKGSIVTLVGEAGLGKSRLMAEIHAEVPPDHLYWVEGRCLSYGHSIAYLLWLDLLRGLLGVSLEDSPATTREALRTWVQGICPGLFPEVYPYLGRMMALPLNDEAATTLRGVEGEQLKANTFRTVETLLECAARQRPLVLVCEDLHWADPTSLELLEQVLSLVDRAPVLFICVFRPEKEHGCWRIRETAAQRFPHCHTDLRLEPLSATESEQLVGNLLRVEGLPLALRARILDHAEGNPFYVEEIIRALIDNGAIVQDPVAGSWIATRDVNQIALPDTLHGVLMARIDRLHEESKRVLQLAAVIGRIFLYRILAAIAQEERELDEHLLTLQQEELIRERASVPELEYIFKHHLTQEAAYRGLLRKDRLVFHRRVAEALERLFSGRVDEQVGLLAYHWERADEPARAIDYLLRAGDQSRLAYAHQEAIDYYQRALALLRGQGDAGRERAAQTLMKLGLAYHTAFDFPRARQAYDESFGLWQRVGDAHEPVAPSAPAPHAFRAAWRDPLTLDPTLAAEAYSRAVIEQLFSGLVAESPELDVVPDVAQSWEMLGEGRQYLFHLRDDVYWSDGVPVTAHDFEYAWKRILDPALDSSNASLLYDVRGARAYHQGDVTDPDLVGVRASDAHTLVVELEEPTSYFPSLLTCPVTYPIPRHVVEVHGPAWAEFANLVTNGPFQLESWQPGQSLVARRNPRYHGWARSSGNVWRVELVLSADSSALLELYDADRLDILSLSAEDKDRAWQRYADEYVSGPRLHTNYVTLNTALPPLDDVRVRRALALAIDTEILAGRVMGGFSFPATGGFVPPGMPGHVSHLHPSYDPVQARQLLADAGYPNGVGLPVLEAMSGRRAWTDMTSYLEAQWRENLGLTIHWQQVDMSTFFAGQARNKAHLALDGWTADCPDPDNFLRASPVRENAQWQHDTYNSLVDKARRLTDQKQRLELYSRAERILADEMAI